MLNTFDLGMQVAARLFVLKQLLLFPLFLEFLERLFFAVLCLFYFF